MRRSLQAAVLVTGTLSLLVSAAAFAVESRLDVLIARLKGADPAGRRQIMKSLSTGDRKALHAEYKALSPAAKQQVRAVLAPGKAKASKAERGPKGGIGTIQYDTGTVHGFRDNSDQVAGNRFNTGFNNPHTISLVTCLPLGTLGSIAMRVYDAPVGTVAPVLASATFPGPSCTWDLPNIVNHNGSFLVGMLQSGSSNTISTMVAAIAVDVNNGGQGFHGMTISINGSGFNPNATVFPGQPYNAILRVSGFNLPVELMSFDVQ